MDEHDERQARAGLAAELALARSQLGQPDLEVRHVELRADLTEGTFDGYACVWDVLDAYGTRFRRGAFLAGGLDQAPYALLWMHNPPEPLGIFTALEDEHGLRIAGRWDDTTDGARARARAQSGSAPGLSVGFVPMGTDPEDSSTFTVCKLVETSQITARMAAVPGASLVGVRSATEAQAAMARGAAAARLMLAGKRVDR